MLRLLVALLCCLWAAEGKAGEGRENGEWLVRLASFVQWPEAVRSGPVVVGLLGPDGGEMVAPGLVAERGRPLLVKHVGTLEEARRCHIVLVGRSHAGRARDVLRGLEGTPTLTVSVVVGFSQMGGMVELREQQGTKMFLLNTDAARRANLAFHPGLLRVVRVARPDTLTE
ncbi:MAG: YfiR family protein [Bryobacterales bacterium]|nr:YfiR family protein [Bryobacterales bacterium]